MDVKTFAIIKPIIIPDSAKSKNAITLAKIYGIKPLILNGRS